ncbi:MAG: 16S rRNA (uracil(1498)-N(3))-methyltransferase [Actinomycetota bacterium]|nr:16S rRNA (uracil(1498)-N(3))-methyltransferase [Actinomycetota bacterium]
MTTGDPRALRSAAAHVFVDDLEAPRLSQDDRHHLERVLRLRRGQAVTVADGAGGWRCCRWGRDAALEPVGEVVRSPAPSPPVTVGFALTKGERPEWVVQKLTEVGVDRIVILVAARSVVRLDEETAGRRVQRWRRVAREAAMQSRRTSLPELEGVLPLAGATAVDGAAAGAVLAEPGGLALSLERPVMVGPEGGWAPEELALGHATVDLGPNVLRAETAAVAAGVLLCSLRTGLVMERGASPREPL